MLGCLFALCHT